MKLNVKDAVKELEDKSYNDIQIETAEKWASRAVAAYKQVRMGAELKEKLAWMLLGDEYAHEAIEHASLVVNDYSLVKEVYDLVKPEKELALDKILEKQ